MRVQKYNFDGTPMNQLTTVFLEKVRFHLPLGLYPGEKLCGNEIFISLSVSISAPNTKYDASFLNYEWLLTIIRSNAEKSCELLEQLAQNILADVHQSLNNVQPERIEVAVEKPHLPVAGFQAASAGIKLLWTR